MPNKDLENKQYSVPPELSSQLGSSLSYENMKMIKTRLEKAKKDNNLTYFNSKGGEKALVWVKTQLKNDQNTIYNKKKIGMDTGRENQFIKNHEKDNKNKNITNIGGVPKINKGNVSRKIMNDKAVYNEQTEKEISKIHYLIEYLNKK